MAYRVRTKIKPESGGNFGCGFTLVFLMGIFLATFLLAPSSSSGSIIMGLLGVGLIVACLYNLHSARMCVCSNCGNEVTHTSKICLVVITQN